ncbi:hypothetical protein EOPP23_09005 [Endozoicomonas sp. OPT23]|uniref:DoxX family protein n=1 Tax=Endozoicomonas sp. OPT23 TaxID=2072845 RepID=UPI00129B45DA|nr:DoxX family protein [Endozoicomonas sp. OPT23]MRI33120.1 hypothetical protein [Endozoicomonas sp. OPT23]
MNATSPAIFRANQGASELLNYSQPLLLLAARFYVAWVFFASGLTKIEDWETTLFLFELEYAVPLISPALAAWLGTAGELIFPVLLTFGLFGRVGALGLTAVNIVAVISLSEIAPAALTLHYLWGVLLLGVVAFGPGKLSVDNFIGAEK